MTDLDKEREALELVQHCAELLRLLHGDDEIPKVQLDAHAVLLALIERVEQTDDN